MAAEEREETVEEMMRRLRERQRRIERLDPAYLDRILRPIEKEPRKISFKNVRPQTEKEKKNKMLLLRSTIADPDEIAAFSVDEYLQRCLNSIQDQGMIGPINATRGFWDTVREVFETQDQRQIHLLKQIFKTAQLRGNLFRFYPGGGYELLGMLNNCPRDLIMPLYDFVLKYKLNERTESVLFSKEHRLRKEKKQYQQEQYNMGKEDLLTREKSKPKEKQERRTMAEEDFPRQAEQQRVRDRVLKKINEQKYGAEPPEGSAEEDFPRQAEQQVRDRVLKKINEQKYGAEPPEGSGLKRSNQWVQVAKNWRV